jgi:hypothetical protein
MIVELSVTVFITQVVFLFARVWNIKAIAKNDIPQALLSGALIHLAWLISLSIGAMSLNEIIINLELSHLPVLAASLAGGTLGSYLSMRNKK